MHMSSSPCNSGENRHLILKFPEHNPITFYFWNLKTSIDFSSFSDGPYLHCPTTNSWRSFPTRLATTHFLVLTLQSTLLTFSAALPKLVSARHNHITCCSCKTNSLLKTAVPCFGKMPFTSIHIATSEPLVSKFIPC